MVILTRLLAKHLYNLDMNKLPLDVLKQSARRGKETTAINSDPSRKRTSFVTGLAYLNTDKLMQVEHLNESGNRTRARTTAAQTSASSRYGTVIRGQAGNHIGRVVISEGLLVVG